MTDDTLSRAPVVNLEIERIERYIPLVLSLHAVLVIFYGKNISFSTAALWIVFLTAFNVSMWLLIRRDRRRREGLFRALYLTAVVWVVMLLSGGTNSFMLFWNLAINVIYP